MSECQDKKEVRTLAQKRAAFALSKVEKILKEQSLKDKLDNKSFKSFVSGAPSMILQNGLGQALAFWMSKAKGETTTKHGYIVEVIREWFNVTDNPLKLENNDQKDFITKLIDKPQKEFLTYQKETLSLLEWFKRYAEAFLSDEDKKEEA